MTVSNRLAAARDTLQAVGQSHVLDTFNALDDAQQNQLLKQIETIDWQEIGRLIDTHVKQSPPFQMPENIEPAPYYPAKAPIKLREKYRKARKLGEQLIHDGKVAAFTVAGGQGTRLGWDAPKGTYPATPITKAPLFGVMADYIRKAQQKWETVIAWYIMTSPANDSATREYFDEHGYFGLEPKNVVMFPQAMMPAFDADSARALMADEANLALSPNGHGGSLKALHTSGAIADMTQRGIEQISYTQVDNPLVKVIDPLFIGLHALDKCEMSSKMVPKVAAKEKVGNFCLADGKITVIEYTHLPDRLAEQCDEDGRLLFVAGSIAIHMMSVAFVEQVNRGGFALPFNRALKKVAWFDPATRQTIEPDQPNAVKLETFVFDALPLCEKSIVYETQRVEEFAPIKNMDDPDPARCVDSPLTSKRLQSQRAARWLEANKVKIPRDDDGNVDAVIEISHLTAIEPDDLKDVDLPKEVDAGTELLL